MIRSGSVNLLIDLFENIFSIAICKCMRLETLEDNIINSSIVNSLEKNDDSFLFRNEKDDLIDEIFKIKISRFDYIKHYDKARWAAEAYISLFLRYKKSFEYLFLYIRLSKMLELYEFYHEQDISQLYVYFEMLTTQKTLLSKLKKKEKMSTSLLSKATGISENTIEKYSKNDMYLYKASFEKIYALSIIFDVKPNIFAKALLINTEKTIENKISILMSQIGFGFLSYYDENYRIEDYEYDSEQGLYIPKDINRKSVLVVSEPESIPDCNYQAENIVLVIVTNRPQEIKNKAINYGKVVVVSQNSVYEMKRTSKNTFAIDEANIKLIENK